MINDRRKILHNTIACKLCGEVIESKHRWDFVRCLCGEVFVDGGKEYVRCGGRDLSNIIFLTEYREDGTHVWMEGPAPGFENPQPPPFADVQQEFPDGFR